MGIRAKQALYCLICNSIGALKNTRRFSKIVSSVNLSVITSKVLWPIIRSQASQGCCHNLGKNYLKAFDVRTNCLTVTISSDHNIFTVLHIFMVPLYSYTWYGTPRPHYGRGCFLWREKCCIPWYSVSGIR